MELKFVIPNMENIRQFKFAGEDKVVQQNQRTANFVLSRSYNLYSWCSRRMILWWCFLLKLANISALGTCEVSQSTAITAEGLQIGSWFYKLLLYMLTTW